MSHVRNTQRIVLHGFYDGTDALYTAVSVVSAGVCSCIFSLTSSPLTPALLSGFKAFCPSARVASPAACMASSVCLSPVGLISALPSLIVMLPRDLSLKPNRWGQAGSFLIHAGVNLRTHRYAGGMVAGPKSNFCNSCVLFVEGPRRLLQPRAPQMLRSRSTPL